MKINKAKKYKFTNATVPDFETGTGSGIGWVYTLTQLLNRKSTKGERRQTYLGFQPPFLELL